MPFSGPIIKVTKMAVFFTSDLHFGHAKVITFCNRPFSSVQDMEECLVLSWNKAVRENDTVYVLGDVFFSNAVEARRVLGRLNGRKILVRGNHDKQVGPSIGWDMVVEEMVIRLGGHRVRLSHFPYPLHWWELTKRFLLKGTRRFADKRPPRRSNEFLLHGHSHSPPDKIVRGRMLDIGVDGHKYTPWHETEIIAKLNLMARFYND